MARLEWDKAGERIYQTGVDHGVLYRQNSQGAYVTGVSWNGLTTVTESPSGAEANPQYADNIKYINLVSAEEFGGTIEAFTYPDEFLECDGVKVINGVALGQQTRAPFGLSYRTLVGNDLKGTDYGYKLHLIYNATAAPSEKAYASINDSPEAATLSWEISTTATTVGTVNGVDVKPLASITVDSTDVAPANLAALETILYGSAGVDPRLPSPAEVLALFSGTVTAVTAVAPAYNSTTKVLTIPNTVGVDYYVDGIKRTAGATITLTKNTVTMARPQSGYVLAADTVDRFATTY